MHGGPLRSDVEAMQGDCTGMTDRLSDACFVMKLMPLDDTVGEAPHASMRHVQLKTRASTWSWQASTFRLKQHLKDLREVLPQIRPATDTQWLWDRWACILQSKRQKELMWRNKRITRKELEKGVYTMAAFRDLDVDAALPACENSDRDDE